MTCDTFTLRTADIQEVFYFNDYDVGEDWQDFPERMVDGIMYDETTGLYLVAYTFTDNRIQCCNSNSSPTDRDTAVTKVEIRAYSASYNSNGTVTAYIRPAFTLGDGDTHSWIPLGQSVGFPPPEWSEWFDITNDTNAPITWTWENVNNLDVDHWMVKTAGGDPNYLVTGRIEIRVTWHDSVILSKPLESSPDNKLDKQLKQFNLWEDYKLHDEGIAGQPLNFNGVEVGVAIGACFPLCFPLCFGKIAAIVAQEKFAKIHNWIENNYNIVLNEFGDCFNAEYAIRDFAVGSMRHPSNYTWKLSLEKVRD